MKKITGCSFLAISLMLCSCVKNSLAPLPAPSTVTSMNDIVSPAAFDWQNSGTVAFTVSVTDKRFQDAIHVISIYDGDPYNGGNLLTKGSATLSVPFKSKVNIPKQINTVFIVKTAADNSKVVQKIVINSNSMVTAIGQ